jgi:hypothetical protein
MRCLSTSLSVSVASDVVVLKGFTEDAPSTTLSGYVVLDLSEATRIDSIALAFVGSASIPSFDKHMCVHLVSVLEISAADQILRPDASYTICTFNSPLFQCNGSKYRYFCPGKHSFPFNICLGGSLPASTVASPRGISYELRASATFQNIRSRLDAFKPISLLRSFPSGSLEFEHPLEVYSSLEYPWFSLTLPHRAWVAGDALTFSFRVLMLEKSAAVMSIETSIVETRRVPACGGWKNRICVLAREHHNFRATRHDRLSERTRSAVRRFFRFEAPQPRSACFHTPQGDSPPATILAVDIPASAQPSHTISPIIITHHVEWLISIVGPDGQSAQARCALPLHVLDSRLRSDVQAATLRARSAFFGLDAGVAPEDELPTYPAHIYDRVAAPQPCFASRAASQIPSYEAALIALSGGLPPLNVLYELPHYRAGA